MKRSGSGRGAGSGLPSGCSGQVRRIRLSCETIRSGTRRASSASRPAGSRRASRAIVSSVIRPSANRLQHRGRSSIRRAIFTRSCARRSDTPAFHCTQCSSDLIPWPRQPSAASSAAIVRTRSAVARLIVPISATVRRSPSRHAASCAGPKTQPTSCLRPYEGGVTNTEGRRVASGSVWDRAGGRRYGLARVGVGVFRRRGGDKEAVAWSRSDHESRWSPRRWALSRGPAS